MSEVAVEGRVLAHSHGNITPEGAVGTAANRAVYTGPDGIMQAGTLPVSAGGTGQSSLDEVRHVLGLGDSTGPVPVAAGGTGRSILTPGAFLRGNGNGEVTLQDPSYFLTPEAAAMYGLGPEVTPNDVLLHIPGQIVVRDFAGWEKIFSYWTPGPFHWTVPDLFWNLPYKIGIVVVGGGGSGAACVETATFGATGGASGYSETNVIWVTPGTVLSGSIGAGGAPVSAQSGKLGAAQGNNGGASAFNGLVAEGGEGGHYGDPKSQYLRSIGAIGGQCSSIVRYQCNPFGGVVVPIEQNVTSTYTERNRGKPLACYHPFLKKAYLGAGGWADLGAIGTGGRDGSGAKFGGDGVYAEGETAQGEGAYQGGCGGGAACCKNGTAVSGAGGGGYVEIYVQGALL